jgi:hypothetical protein
MSGQRRQVGDRVCLLQPYRGLPSGSLGTITRSYQAASDYYQVRFDTTATTHPVPVDFLGDVLEHSERHADD